MRIISWNVNGIRAVHRKGFARWLRSSAADIVAVQEVRATVDQVRERNIGWRLDYVLASPGAMPYVRSAAIHPEVKGSDHCPVSVELDPKVM